MSVPKLSRDVVILVVALALGAWEVLHEARPAVLTFIGALLAGPLVMRADESRKKTKDDDKAGAGNAD